MIEDENTKDPKTMSSSDLLRWAANGEENEYGYRSPGGKLFCLLLGTDAYTAHTGEERRALRSLADKIAGERAAAYSDGFFAGKNVANWSLGRDLAAAKSWPARKEDETIREYISRCFLPLPRYEDGEPVRPCDEWKAIMMSLDGARFQLLEGYPDGLCFAGDPVKRPAPEALGADGLPIVAGETVYMAGSLADTPNDKAADTVWAHGGPLLVLGESDRAGYLICKNDMGVKLDVRPEDLSHTPPDTQERIGGDASKDACEYCEGILKPFPKAGRGKESGIDLSLDCDGTAMLEVPDIEFDGESYEVPQITFLFKRCPMCGRDLREVGLGGD